MSGFQVRAGGSGLNTVVMVNQLSTNSCELGNYYCERRGVPPENVLRIAWPGDNISWSSGDFQTNLLSPLLDMLTARQLSNQIDYVVLSMDIPFQTLDGTKPNSTTSALFYGLKDDSGANWMDVTNSYSTSEQVFQQAKPASAPSRSFLTSMITAGSLAQAKMLVDQGVASDGTFPAQTVILAKSSDPLRNVRYHAFDNAIFNTRLRGNYSMVRTNEDSPVVQTNLLGFQTGLANLSIPPNGCSPGAMADSLTSFGGIIFGPNGQTSLLAFINAGAAGSYGTVTEPSTNPQKFPDPQAYFYQSRGFSLTECYYQSLYAPYQGLIVAEPLAAPFAQTGSGNWTGGASNAVLTGTAQLGMAFLASDGNHPLQQIDLFVDGKYFQTVTNLAPRPGNLLTVTLNGYPLTYTVPTNATPATVANDLATLLNGLDTNLTQVAALVHGDRVELHLSAANGPATPFFFTDRTTTNPAGRYYKVQYVSSLLPPQLTSPGRSTNGAFRAHMETPLGVASYVQASTDLASWLTIFTNLVGGPLDWVDAAASGYTRRFYRIVETVPNPIPQLASLGLTSGPGFKLRVSTASVLPYTIQSSTNLADWTPVYTNSAGGTMDFIDAQATNTARRFFRALVLAQTAAAPAVSVQSSTNADGLLLQVQGAVQPYVILESADQIQWTPVFTNVAVGQVQATVGSSAGSAGALTTFLTVSRSAFLDSIANGLHAFSFSGSITVGAWLQATVTKTNGAVLSLNVTNQSVTAALFDLVQQLVAAINSSPALQGSDGLVAEDLSAGAFGSASCNLRARSPGRDAAAIQVQLLASAGANANPSTPVSLNVNLPDLQPRNHLYVSAGATSLAATFPLDTTRLADGFHELAAVAYEGSDVRTQTRITLPIQVQNSPLSASLTLLDLAGTAPVQGTYHIQVAANTGGVSAISLFSTGGLLSTLTNQSTATFTVAGSTLGAGLHPFYAQVQTPGGAQYRTQVQWARLVNPQ
jgi:uncharacterized protein (TIGR03790 family)